MKDTPVQATSQEDLQKKLSQKIEALWRLGDLTYKLHSGQRELKAEWLNMNSRLGVLLCSRRWGKSYLLSTMAIEQCIRKERSQVRYAAAFKNDVVNIITPIFEHIMSDMPKDMYPTYFKHDGIWQFPNGSKIFVAGIDGGGADKLRGVSSELILIDEAGSVGSDDGEELVYAISSVLKPQLITTDGRIFMASTMSPYPLHAFNTKYVPEARERGELIEKTLLDAPHIPEERKWEFINEDGGLDSPTVQREYFNKAVIDTNRAVLPEFQDCKDNIIQTTESPEYWKTCVSIDFGWSDLTAVLFGYWDCAKDRLVVQAELEFQRESSQVVIPEIRVMETKLWGHPGDQRIADATPDKVVDLKQGYDFLVAPPAKSDKMGAVEDLRRALVSGRVIVDPRCENLIAHCLGGVWRGNFKEFSRSAKQGKSLGHFDFIDALLYMWRGIDRRNPIRPNTRASATRWVSPRKQKKSTQLGALLQPRWKRNL